MHHLKSLNYTKPFSKVKQYSVHPLSEKGLTYYISTNFYATNFLNKLNPREEDDNIRTQVEELNLENEREKYIENFNKQNHYYHQVEETIHNYFKINDLIEVNRPNLINEINKANTSLNFYNKEKKNSINLIPEYKFINDKNVLRESKMLKNIETNLNNTKKNFFQINQLLKPKSKSNYISCKTKNYVEEMKKFTLQSTDSKESNSLLRSKRYDGFKPTKVPRINKRFSSEFTENDLIKNNYSQQMVNSLRKAYKMFYKSNKSKLDYLCQEENKKLRTIISDQSNPDFLKKSNLPKISFTINTPKFLISNTKLQYSKNCGEKFISQNKKAGSSKNGFRRNTNGGHFGN